MTYRDHFGSGAGFLSSPSEGTLGDLVAAIARLDDSADVRTERRVGVSVEYRSAAIAANVGFRWGSPWLDRAPAGLRPTWVVREPSQDVETYVGWAAALGMHEVAFGHSLCAGELDRGLNACAERGLSAVVEGGPTALRALEVRARKRFLPAAPAAPEVPAGPAVGAEPGVLLVGLASTVCAALDAAPDLGTRIGGGVDSPGHPQPQDVLIKIAQATSQELRHALTRIAAVQVPVVPLVVASGRRADLAAAAAARGGAELARVLPFHRRIAGLSAPGAMAMGRREASRHLGLRALGREGNQAVRRGSAALRDAVAAGEAAGVVLLGGSGAPGVGLCPGHALIEELQAWEVAGVTATSIERGFLDHGPREADQPAADAAIGPREARTRDALTG